MKSEYSSKISEKAEHAYFQYVMSMPILTDEEDLLLRKEVARGNDDARNTLIERSLRLPIAMANQFKEVPVPFMDLVQQGNLGLIKASTMYDYERGVVKFGTYATWWIKHYMNRCISGTTRIIRYPDYIEKNINKFKRARNNFIKKYGTEPAIKDLAFMLNLPEYKVLELYELDKPYFSIDDYIDRDSENNSFSSQLADTKIPDVDAGLISEERNAAVKVALDALTPREKLVVQFRYMDDNNLTDPQSRNWKEDTLISKGVVRTYNHVGKLMGISRQRVEKLNVSALRKLKRSKVLKLYVV